MQDENRSYAAILNMALLDCQIQQERLRIWQSEPAKAHVFFKMRIAAVLWRQTSKTSKTY
jgi:hypothetical protein